MLLIGSLIFGCTKSGGSEQDKEQENESPEQVEATNQFNLGATANDFSLQDLDGNTVNLSGLSGSYVVIHFATTWCPFCNAEAPYL